MEKISEIINKLNTHMYIHMLCREKKQLRETELYSCTTTYLKEFIMPSICLCVQKYRGGFSAGCNNTETDYF